MVSQSKKASVLSARVVVTEEQVSVFENRSGGQDGDLMGQGQDRFFGVQIPLYTFHVCAESETKQKKIRTKFC